MNARKFNHRKKSKHSKRRLAAKAARHQDSVADGTCYAGRDRYLAELGFQDYSSYLAYPMWMTVKARVRNCHGFLCKLCREPAWAIHHTRYHRDDLTGECMDHLHPLCDLCHKTVEFDETGRKLNMQNAIAKFYQCLKFSKVNGSNPEGTRDGKKDWYYDRGMHRRSQPSNPKPKCFACGKLAGFTWRFKEFSRTICEGHYKIMSKEKDVSVVFALVKKWEANRALPAHQRSKP